MRGKTDTETNPNLTPHAADDDANSEKSLFHRKDRACLFIFFCVYYFLSSIQLERLRRDWARGPESGKTFVEQSMVLRANDHLKSDGNGKKEFNRM